MSEIKVGFTAIVGNEHFPVFVRVHCARIEVDVGIKLLHRYAQATHLQQSTKRTGSEPFTERADHTTRDENMLGQLVLRPSRALTRC